MNKEEIENTVITGGYTVNDARFNVVTNAAGEHYLHIDHDAHDDSFLRLGEAEVRRAHEIADAFPKQDHRRAFALAKLAQQIRSDRFLR